MYLPVLLCPYDVMCLVREVLAYYFSEGPSTSLELRNKTNIWSFFMLSMFSLTVKNDMLTVVQLGCLIVHVLLSQQSWSSDCSN